jgi:hypothetical protein
VKQTSETGGQVAEDIESADAGSLPFTGAPLLLWLVVACGLFVSGLLLRRVTSATGAVEPAGEATPLPVQPSRLPRTTKPSFLRAIVLPSLSLVAFSALLRYRIRR